MKEVRCVFMFAVLTLWMALPVGAQNAKRGITMSLVNESLASALRKVQQESDYKVSFVIEDVKSYTTTVHLKNASASTAVKQILQGKPFTYSVSGKFIKANVQNRGFYPPVFHYIDNRSYQRSGLPSKSRTRF